jgi:hypothetical protein
VTLTGEPDARELPLYGSKVLAVREGVVQMVGLPKLPTYAFLAATAAPGDSSITVAGQVNWAVGDAIAIASSSFIGARLPPATPRPGLRLALPCTAGRLLCLRRALPWGLTHSAAGC